MGERELLDLVGPATARRSDGPLAVLRAEIRQWHNDSNARFSFMVI